MINDPTTANDEHLRLLSIFHYVVGGMTGLFSCFPIIHVAVGVAMVTGAFNAQQRNPHPPPDWFGWIFILIGGAIVVTGWGLAGAMLYAGKLLSERRRHTFCIVVAGLECVVMPFGTVLGVLTIVTLSKPEVKAQFEAQPTF